MSEENSTPPDQNRSLTILGQFIGDIQQAMPETVKKNFLKAGNQLIFGMADIPLAWLEQFSKRIRRKTEAMDMIQKGENTAIIRLFEQDPALAQETLNFNSLKEYKAFFNRQKIVQGAIDELKNNPPEEDSDKEIDEDWLEIFSKAAETKSSEDVQLIFSKILARESKSPGSFSPKTIHTLSIMGKWEARMFLQITSFTTSIAYKPEHPLYQVFKHSRQFHVLVFNKTIREEIPPYGALSSLQDLGLLKTDHLPFELKNFIEHDTNTYIGSSKIDFSKEQSNHLLSRIYQRDLCKRYHFTNAGEELLSIVKFSLANMAYLQTASKYLLTSDIPKEHSRLKVEL